MREVKVLPGRITGYDEDVGLAMAELDDGGWTTFKSVDFSSGSGAPARFPRVGERVKVITAGGEVIVVRAAGEYDDE